MKVEVQQDGKVCMQVGKSAFAPQLPAFGAGRVGESDIA